MKYTNNHNLPGPVMNAVAKGGSRWLPTNQSIRVTTLIKPPQIVLLESAHWDELEIDAMALIDAAFGTGIHTVLEGFIPRGKAELSLVIPLGFWTITGTADWITDDGILIDWKTCSTWKIKYEDFTDWTMQLNCYAYMAKQMGFRIKELCVWAYVKDLNSRERDIQKMHKVEIPLWTDKATLEFMSNRVADIEQAIQSHPRPCTDAERWKRGGQYALMRKGRQRAVRLYDNELSAVVMTEGDSKLYVEQRPKEYIRCEKYCMASKWCPQWSATDSEPSALT